VTVSLDGLLDRDDNNDGSSSSDMPADPGEEDFTQRLEKRQLLEALTTAVTGLPEREWLIVSLYYRDEMTMKEIAHILEISESRVCQLHGRALSRLRARLARDRAA
jgi:RNA polymerase sigma factor for flagellar operon FliA